jgi:hypothetical protein
MAQALKPPFMLLPWPKHLPICCWYGLRDHSTEMWYFFSTSLMSEWHSPTSFDDAFRDASALMALLHQSG